MNEASINKLGTCSGELIRLILAVDAIYPIQVTCGYRGKEEQDLAFKNKKSKLQFPKSKHNSNPSMAVDIVPDPDKNSKTIDWNDIKEFEKMCSIVEERAKELNIKIRLGRDFSFKDYPHIELI